MRLSHESIEMFRQRLTNARNKLLTREPFLGFLALELPTHVIESPDHEVHTAATDGRSYLYNYGWCRQLTDPELVFVVAHEVAHVMFLHNTRCGGRDRRLWNAACDFAINGILIASAGPDGPLAGVAAMPTEVDPQTRRVQQIGLYDAKFANLPAETIYDELVKGSKVFVDNWDLLLGPKTESEAICSVTQARAAVAKALIRAQDSRKRKGLGDASSQWERYAEKEIRGTVRWQDRLRQGVLNWGGDALCWNQPNRKYRPLRIYLPRHRGYQLPNILCAFDTSGSVSDKFLGQMVAELNQLLLQARNSLVRLVCCDTQLQVIGDFSATRRLDLQIQSFHGGGGTDFRPVFDYARTQKSFRHLVYLTDGAGKFPDVPQEAIRTLWLMPESSCISVPFGEVITLPPID